MTNTLTFTAVPIALSESHILVWANEAEGSEDYFCVGCGTLVQVDSLRETFIHPADHHCSPTKNHQKSALLYLEQILHSTESRLQISVPCRACETTILLDIRGRPELVATADGTEALLVEDSVRIRSIVRNDGTEAASNEDSARILFLMRPASDKARESANMLAAACLEVDARNVISGGPVALLNRAECLELCEICKTHSGI